MRLMIIRHAEPDYTIDSLTEKGWREAELLAERIARIPVRAFYVSPLGRARDTASVTLKKMGRTAVECEWLKEFCPEINRPDRTDRKKCAWDWLPQDWTGEEDFFRRDLWASNAVMREGNVWEEYQRVIAHFDALLGEHGYEREGEYYRVRRANRDTVVFFCHFGLECVLLSRLMNVSPMILWHHFCAAPSSVTTVYTEERRRGIASFRAASFGDISHLYAGGEEPSFAARFCETFDCEDERHD